MNLELLEKELMKLSKKEKAILTYKLLESLEGESSPDIDEIWINVALNRYKQIKEGKDVLIDGESVIREVKSKYK